MEARGERGRKGHWKPERTERKEGALTGGTVTSRTLLGSGTASVGSFCRKTGALAPEHAPLSRLASGFRISWLNRLMKKSRAFFRLSVKEEDELVEQSEEEMACPFSGYL